MDPYILTIKYIFKKNNKNNEDISINDFFSNGISFPQFVAILFGVENIPGISTPKNKIFIANNNTKALLYLGQNNPFFKSFGVDFNDEKNKISLINLILSKVYFKINRTSFLQKCNDFLKSKETNISSFNEFIQGNGFMKLMNAISNDIPIEINLSKDDLIEKLIQYINSLNIPVIIDESSLIPMNQDTLMYQALIIIDNKNNSLPDEKIKETLDTNDKNVSFESQSVFTNTSNNNPNLNLLDKPNKINVETNINNNNVDYVHFDKNINNQDNKNNLCTHEKVENNSEKQINLNENNTSETNIKLSNNIFESSDITNLPKSSYLNIINHIMEINNRKGVIYFSDFEQGIILPNLVEILLNEKIPNLVDDPIGYDQLMNNMSTLYFINQKDPSFNPRQYNVTKKDDIINLLRILLKKYLFTKNCLFEMKKECNEVLHNLNIIITNFNIDWDNGRNFVGLLHFLSRGEIIFPPKDNLDINQLKNYFVKANCRSVIENDSLFGNADEIAILYQIKIILDDIKKRNIFTNESNRVHEIKNIPKTYDDNTKPVISKIQNDGNSIIGQTIKEDNSNDNNDQVQNDENKNGNDGKISSNCIYVYTPNSCPVLRLLNIIGLNIGIKYDSLDEIINGMTLPILVKYLMGVGNIPGIKMSAAFEKMNVNAVLNFLMDKNTVFRYSSFDFNTKSTKKENIIWFATTLLKQFYLKNSKIKIMAEVSDWLGTKIIVNDIKHFFNFGNGFLKVLGYNIDSNKNYYDEKALINAFQKSNVPFILDEDSLTNINDDYICFQLKLIFDYASKSNFDKEEALEEIYQPDDKNKSIMPISDDNDQNNKLFKLKSIIQELKANDNKDCEEENLDEIPFPNLKVKNVFEKLKLEIKTQDNEEPKNCNNSAINDTISINMHFNSEKIQDIIGSLKNTIKEQEIQPTSDDNKENGIINDNVKELANVINDINGSTNGSNKNDRNLIISEKENTANDQEEVLDNVNKLYTNDNSISEEFISEIDELYNELFNVSLSKVSEVDDQVDLKTANYHVYDKNIDVFPLLEFNSESWVFNRDHWLDFISKYELDKNAVLYLVLLPPYCTDDNKSENDFFYRLLSTITACKIMHKDIPEKVFVEFGFCGKIHDICKRFDIHPKKTIRNEYIGLIHIRYPPSFNNNIIIECMQAALTLKADYIVAFYSKSNIIDSIRIINGSMYQTCFYTGSYFKKIGVSLIFLTIPVFCQSVGKKICNPKFQNELNLRLRLEYSFITLMKHFQFAMFPTIQWINLNNFNTYSIFLEEIINHCQKEYSYYNYILDDISNFFGEISNVGSVHNQKDMNNFIYKISKIKKYNIYNNNETKIEEILSPSLLEYQISGEINIKFNQSVWDKFIQSNKIDIDSSLATVLFINSDPDDVNLMLKPFIDNPFPKEKSSNYIQVHITSCGLIGNLEARFNKKSSRMNNNRKTHLTFINIIPCKNDYNKNVLLNLDFIMSSNIYIIITIPNKQNYEKQIKYSNKLRNLLLFEKQDSDFFPKFIYLFNDSQNNQTNEKQLELIDKNIPSSFTKFYLNPDDNDSCISFVSLLDQIIQNYGKSAKEFYDYLINIKDNIPKQIFINIMQDLITNTEHSKKGKDDMYILPEQKREKIIKRMTKYYTYYFKNDNNIVSIINQDFAYLCKKLYLFKNIRPAIKYIKNEIPKKYVDIVYDEYISSFMSVDQDPNDFLPKVEEFINNRVTYIEEETIDILKDSCKEEIKDILYDIIYNQCLESKCTELAYIIYESIITKYDDKINQCMAYIDSIYEKTKEYKKEDIVLNKDQIAQESMKYTLAVKESFKEMTVEITCDEDLEREIPNDY